jgi:hypothetical protein
VQNDTQDNNQYNYTRHAGLDCDRHSVLTTLSIFDTLSAVILRVIMMSVFISSFVILRFIILSFIMLTVVMLSVVILGKFVLVVTCFYL